MIYRKFGQITVMMTHSVTETRYWIVQSHNGCIDNQIGFGFIIISFNRLKTDCT